MHEAAEIIQKLQLIAQELPPRKFSEAIKAIDKKYMEIERDLIEEFVKSHRSNDYPRMKEIAVILSHFKGYNQCVDAFIEQIQVQHHRGKDIFRDVLPLCESSWKLIGQVSFMKNLHRLLRKHSKKRKDALKKQDFSS